MKKSIAIVLFVIQILLVFVFENIYSIFKQLEKQEMASIQARADSMAELVIERFKNDPGAIGQQGYFDDIQVKYRVQPSASVMVIDGQEFYIITRILEGNRGAIFRKNIISTSLNSIRRLIKIFFGMIIVIGIFLIFTGFYLVYLFRKFKGDIKVGQIPPLQDYLKELRDSEIALKGIIQQQQISAAQKEELNKNIINNINAAIILINASSRVDIFNPAAGKMFNQSFAHAKNNELKKVLHQFPQIPDFVEQHRGQKRSSEITAGKRIFRIDLLPVPQIGQLLMIKDITEEKMREEISHKNKNFAMLGEMTAFLTHEIRNSLGVILGYTKTIRAETQKMQKVNSEIRHLSTMMESFMNFARPMEVKNREPVHLLDLLNQLSREREIPIKVNSQEQDIGLETDPALLKSALLNLVLNAREAGASTIEVDIKEDEHLNLWFKDDGGGIDENIREKIWFPFFTTKEKGTGMGLAIVRKIITTLRGDITLEKSPPGTTTFKLTFYK
jgi:signal transduction histidine kinase